MPRKKIQPDDTDSEDSTTPTVSQPAAQQSGPFSGQSASASKTSTILLYVAVVVIVAIIAAIGYYAYSSLTAKSSGESSTQILNNISSNSSLNSNQSMFIKELEKSEGINGLYVRYYNANATVYLSQPNNATIAVNVNQTIDSYKLGNYNVTKASYITSFQNAATKQFLAENISDLYYYNTNTTMVCFNETDYYAGVITNASLQCAQGDQGQSYVEQFPFTAANVSSLASYALNGSVSYKGSKAMIGRNCDEFVISNETPENLLSNYSVVSMCLDSQYGIPLYFNQTTVAGGMPSSFALTATIFSTNVSSSEFVIPQAYLSNESKPLI